MNIREAISQKISEVSANRLSVWAFGQWLDPLSWSMHRDLSADDVRLISSLQSALDSFDYEGADELALRRELLALVPQTFSIVLNLPTQEPSALKEDNEFLKGYRRCKICELPRIKENGRNKRAKNPQLYRKHANTLRVKNRAKFLKQDKTKREASTLKTCARKILQLAVKGGIITRPLECSNCHASNKRIDGHHTDYLKPLEVEWLCSTCHGLTFRKQGK